jgi:hypothetical protein
MGTVNVHILNTQSGWNGKLVSSYRPKFATVRLFVETMPIYKVKQAETERRSFTRKQYVQITLDRHNDALFTVSFPTSVIFRYHLPF